MAEVLAGKAIRAPIPLGGRTRAYWKRLGKRCIAEPKPLPTETAVVEPLPRKQMRQILASIRETDADLEVMDQVGELLPNLCASDAVRICDAIFRVISHELGSDGDSFSIMFLELYVVDPIIALLGKEDLSDKLAIKSIQLLSKILFIVFIDEYNPLVERLPIPKPYGDEYDPLFGKLSTTVTDLLERKGLSDAVLIKLIKVCERNEWFLDVASVLERDDLSDAVRKQVERSLLKGIRFYARGERNLYISEILKTRDLPDSVRIAGEDALRKAGYV